MPVSYSVKIRLNIYSIHYIGYDITLSTIKFVKHIINIRLFYSLQHAFIRFKHERSNFSIFNLPNSIIYDHFYVIFKLRIKSNQ